MSNKSRLDRRALIGAFVSLVVAAPASAASGRLPSALDPFLGGTGVRSQADLGKTLTLGVVRADIPTIAIPLTSFRTLGHAAPDDGGAGTWVRGTSGGLMAIQDSAGTWWNLALDDLGRPEQFGYRFIGDAADQAALQACLDRSSGARLRQKTYLLRAPLDLGSTGKFIIGVSKKLYPNFNTDWQTAAPSWEGQCTTIQYVNGVHGAIFSGGTNCILESIVCRTGQARNTSDILFGGSPSHIAIKGCTFQNLNYLASNSAGAWGAWSMLDTTVIGCGAAAYGAFLDSRIIGCTFTSIAGKAFVITAGGGNNQWIGSRFEFSNGAGIEISGQCLPSSISANLFDACNTAAVVLNNCTAGQSVTGNTFMRNGQIDDGTPLNSSHIHMIGPQGHNINNSYYATGLDDGSHVVPKYIIGLENCANANTYFGGNVRAGCTTSIIAKDLNSNSTNALNIPSIDLPSGQSPNVAGDDFATALAQLSAVACPGAIVNVYQARRIGDYVAARNIVLRGSGAAPIVLTASNGAIGFAGMDNITYGGITYSMRRGDQYASDVPNAYGLSGTWLVGDVILRPAPTPGGPAGWVKTANGSPDTWSGWGAVAP